MSKKDSGFEVLKEESNIYVKDGKHYEEFNSVISLTPEQHLANYYFALRNKLGLLTRKLNTIKQIKSMLFSIKTEIKENLEMTDKMIGKYEKTYAEMLKLIGNKKMKNKLFGQEAISKKEYKSKKKEIQKAIAQINEDIEKAINELIKEIQEEKIWL